MSKKRIYWLDYVRSMAIFLVVLTHALEAVYNTGEGFAETYSGISQAFFLNAFNLTRHGVPLFLMITGYLILSKNFVLSSGKSLAPEVSVVDFWKRNCLRLLLTLEIWIVIYNIFRMVFYHETYTVVRFLKTLLFLEGVGFSHQWYIYMIMGMYIFLPFVAVVLQKTQPKLLCVPLAVVGVCYFVLPTLNVIRETLDKQPWNSQLNLSFSGGVYGAYMILGYLVYKGCFKKIKPIFLIGLSVISFVFGTWLQYFSCRSGAPSLVWYNWVTLIPTSLCIFELFSRTTIGDSFLSKAMVCLSRCSFGIYLLHNLILKVLTRYVPLTFKLPVNVLVYCAVTFLLSWLCIYSLSRIPKIGKYLTYVG